MKSKILFWLIFSVIITLVLPWVSVKIIPEDFGMITVLRLFFVINPIYSIISGIFSGRHLKQMWTLPIISALMFLFGAWLFFDKDETAFVLYTGIYLAISTIFMLIARFSHKQD